MGGHYWEQEAGHPLDFPDGIQLYSEKYRDSTPIPDESGDSLD